MEKLLRVLVTAACAVAFVLFSNVAFAGGDGGGMEYCSSSLRNSDWTAMCIFFAILPLLTVFFWIRWGRKGTGARLPVVAVAILLVLLFTSLGWFEIIRESHGDGYETFLWCGYFSQIAFMGLLGAILAFIPPYILGVHVGEIKDYGDGAATEEEAPSTCCGNADNGCDGVCGGEHCKCHHD